ncbi:MAG: Asp-tRNA(Asn)/Glu-tRNA(Gln) amidotransferase GatCAB subunit B, partial [Rhodospirillales bacterium]|nr:Asp-tRNA(Asn)/Glu-tRNA(Gln) amidotransferase GatCAB subunit B [Rhodospirillales bacterium]
SVRHPGEDLRARSEIKNVNSVRFAMQATAFEAERQVELYEDGGQVVQETRLFDAATGETRSMRSKEEAHDYRYFPDPDLLPVQLTQEYVDAIKETLPELPDAKKARFVSDYGLGPKDAAALVAEKETAEYFEIVVKSGKDAKLAANWTLHELFGVLNKQGLGISASPVAAENLGKLVGLIADGTISGRIAKDVFEVMIAGGGDPEAIVEEKGLKQITDTGEIEAVIDTLIADNPEQAQKFKDGNPKVGGWFVGQAMQATQGKANPQLVGELLKKKLG